jgi:LPS export ABC transporter protein LptC
LRLHKAQTILQKNWRLSATVLAVFVLVYWVSQSGNDDTKKIMSFQKADNLTETGTDVQILYTDNGNPKAKIITPELTRILSEEGITEFKKGLKIFFYDAQEQIESSMTANYGKAFEKNEELFAKDNVVIINVKGEKMETEELTWKRKEKKIYSDKFVKITTADEIIFGNGMEANEDFSDYVIKEVKGTIKVDAKEFEKSN